MLSFDVEVEAEGGERAREGFRWDSVSFGVEIEAKGDERERGFSGMKEGKGFSGLLSMREGYELSESFEFCFQFF